MEKCIKFMCCSQMSNRLRRRDKRQQSRNIYWKLSKK